MKCRQSPNSNFTSQDIGAADQLLPQLISLLMLMCDELTLQKTKVIVIV